MAMMAMVEPTEPAKSMETVMAVTAMSVKAAKTTMPMEAAVSMTATHLNYGAAICRRLEPRRHDGRRRRHTGKPQHAARHQGCGGNILQHWADLHLPD
jgi:hypothetical protein